MAGFSAGHLLVKGLPLGVRQWAAALARSSTAKSTLSAACSVEKPRCTTLPSSGISSVWITWPPHTPIHTTHERLNTSHTVYCGSASMGGPAPRRGSR